MKSILLTSKPIEAVNILNDKQKIIVRKKFPKDYEGWVYIYCTKGKKHQDLAKDETTNSWKLWYGSYRKVNSKVVARFWCDKVEEMYTDENGMSYYTDTIKEDYMVSKLACLDDSDIYNYLGDKIGCAIHISKLEIFNKPRELGELGKNCLFNTMIKGVLLFKTFGTEIKKAPKNYCYIEEELENDK